MGRERSTEMVVREQAWVGMVGHTEHPKGRITSASVTCGTRYLGWPVFLKGVSRGPKVP